MQEQAFWAGTDDAPGWFRAARADAETSDHFPRLDRHAPSRAIRKFLRTANGSPTASSTPDLDSNHSIRDIWLVPAAGGDARQLTRGGSDTRPRWSPDGKKLAFISERDGTPQVYYVPLEGGEATRVTFLSTGADNELWSPDGKTIAFISSVYPDCKDDVCNAQRDSEKAQSKVHARDIRKIVVSPLDRLVGR